MALQIKNWAVSSYTNNTWTPLVSEPATIATITVANTAGSSVDIQIRVEDSTNNVASIVPLATIDVNGTYTIDIRSMNITGTQTLQVQATLPGVEFFASGVISV